MADPFDPFATAGFAPQAAPSAAAPFDPFSDAGFKAVPTTSKQATISQPIGVSEFGAPIFANDADNAAVLAGEGAATRKVMEGASLGLAPFVEAGARSAVSGAPYSDSLAASRKANADVSASYPVGSLLAEGVGSVIPTMMMGGVAGPLSRAAGSIAPRVGPWLANTALGAAYGGATAAGNDVGAGTTGSLGTDTAIGTGLGGAVSGVTPLAAALLQSAPNMARGVVAGVRNMATDSGREGIVGSVLREASGDFQNSAARSPIPDLQLRTAQTTGNPGIAALDRTLASEPGASANNPGDLVNNGRTANQTNTLARALVGDDAGIEPSVLASQNSSRGVSAIEAANDALRAHAQTLWQDPHLTGVQIPSQNLIGGVQGDLATMPPAFRNAITNGPLSGHLEGITSLPENASVADINAIRSPILADARAAAARGDNVTATAANRLADSVLNHTNAAMADQSPEAQAAYQAARDFTRQRTQATGYPEFNAILRPNSSGNMSADPNAAFGRFFNLSNGSDTGPQRLQSVSDLLRTTGPVGAESADELQGASQDYLKSAILRQARAGGGVDATGQPATNMATLNSTVNKTMPTVNSTPMLAPIAQDIQAAGNAAELLNRPSTLRGDNNSTTFEKLRNNDLVSAIVGQSGSSGLGAVGGGALGGYESYQHDSPILPGVAGGALAGALAGRMAGPAIGKAISHIPGAGALVTGPTDSIKRSLAAALANPDEYSRLMQVYPYAAPGLFQPGQVSGAVNALRTPLLGPISAASSGQRP